MKNSILMLCVGMMAGIVPATVSAQNSIPGYTINSSTAASTVQTQYGSVAGYIENGLYNYKGIPYASASRFGEPHAPEAWSGVRAARCDGRACPQELRSAGCRDGGALASQGDDGLAGEDGVRVSRWTPRRKEQGG